MKTVVDALGREVTFSGERIICICPAITETLFALGLGEQIVGRTRYCLYPKGDIEQVPIVGGTKKIDLEKVLALAPDIIITEKEDNSKEIVELLEQHVPVYVAQVESVEGAYTMVREMGALFEKTQQAEALVVDIEAAFARLTKREVRAGYVIWRKPYMVAGATTYINDVLQKLGFTNPFAEAEGRYPAVDEEMLQAAHLDVLFLATEPFPFTVQHTEEFRRFLPDVDIQLIDGEMFWYGAKMKQAPIYFQRFFDV